MNSSNGPEEQSSKIDWMGLARAHGRFALTVAAGLAAVVAVVGVGYVRWGQGTQTLATLEFRPTFLGTAAGLNYPNGLPFSPNDVTAGPIVDLVFDGNNIGTICSREAFRAGFFVEQRSDQSVFLDMEYQSRLSEPRITIVERRLLQEEHAAKRRALPLQYRLVFVTPPSCAALPPVVLTKAMVEVLSTWASESETKRGVLNYQIEVLTPATLDVMRGAGGLLLKADILRNAITRVIQNIDEVAEIPGTMLIRIGPSKTTFAEVKGKLTDLIGSRLDPLVLTSGQSMVNDSASWVAETIAGAVRRQEGAEMVARSYRQGLQEFSGASQGAATGRASAAVASPSATNPQSLIPFDAAFIDRIVQMSATNEAYRQELTKEMVKAELRAVAEQQRAAYYKRLQQSFKGPSSAKESADLMARFNEIVEEGKELTKQFGELYDEFSRVSLRAAGALYETVKPVNVSRMQRFSNSFVVKLAGVTFVGTLLLVLSFFLLRDRLNLVPR